MELNLSPQYYGQIPGLLIGKLSFLDRELRADPSLGLRPWHLDIFSGRPHESANQQPTGLPEISRAILDPRNGEAYSTHLAPDGPSAEDASGGDHAQSSEWAHHSGTDLVRDDKMEIFTWRPSNEITSWLRCPKTRIMAAP